MFNRITIVGRITKDPELKQTNNGRAYTRFTLAVNTIYNKPADFIPVIAWNQAAENLVNYQKKGSLILVDGQLQVRTTGEEGNRRTYFDVVAAKIIYMESRKSATTDHKSTTAAPAAPSAQTNSIPPITPSSSTVTLDPQPSTTNPTTASNSTTPNQSTSTPQPESKNTEDDIFWDEE